MCFCVIICLYVHVCVSFLKRVFMFMFSCIVCVSKCLCQCVCCYECVYKCMSVKVYYRKSVLECLTVYVLCLFLYVCLSQCLGLGFNCVCISV